MGAYTCQFGKVHKMCRCPKPHTMNCDKPDEHGPKTVPENVCLVLEMKLDGRLPMGKREAHPPHDWWYTSSGGGHQLEAYDPTEKNCRPYHCPGRGSN